MHVYVIVFDSVKEYLGERNSDIQSVLQNVREQKEKMNYINKARERMKVRRNTRDAKTEKDQTFDDKYIT